MTERDEDDDEDEDDDVPASRRLTIGLEHMRFRHLSWTGIGIVVGALLIWKLGTVAQWAGVGLIGFGLWAGYNFARTLLYPAGTIIVDEAGVELPRGLCKGEPSKFKLGEVAHAYLLRRAVPWTRAAPVLVVEAGGKAFSYPRDWFLTEADQRRVVRELHARGSTPVAEDVYEPGWRVIDPVPVHSGSGLGPVISGKERGFKLHHGGVSDGTKGVSFVEAELFGSTYDRYELVKRIRASHEAFDAYTYVWLRQADDRLEQFTMRDEIPAKATRQHGRSRVESLRASSSGASIAIPAEQIAAVRSRTFVHRFPAVRAAYERGEDVAFGKISASRTHLATGTTTIPWSSIRAIRLDAGTVSARTDDSMIKLGQWSEIPNVSMLMSLLNVVVGLDVESGNSKS